MGRSMMLFAALLTALNWSVAMAPPGETAAGSSNPQWRGKLCANCQQDNEAASRVRNEVQIATKLVAANTCADPGTLAWFAEEEDHVSAFLNSSVVRYK
jgi:hypothetical protein